MKINVSVTVDVEPDAWESQIASPVQPSVRAYILRLVRESDAYKRGLIQDVLDDARSHT